MNSQKTWLGLLLFVMVLLNLYFHFSFEGTIDERGAWLDRSLAEVVRPFRIVVSSTGNWVEEGSAKLNRLWEADQENLLLKNQIEETSLALQRLREVEQENDRLRQLLNFRPALQARMLASRIIGRDLSNFYRSIVIDRGENDGIQKEMAVISLQGAVGRILRTSSDSATVLLIDDLNSRVDGIIQRSRSQVIVGGSAQGDLRLELLPRRADVREGDVIVTSSLGGIFPAGIPIGTIIGRGHDPNFVLEDALVEPAVDFEKLEEVFVVTGFDVRKGS